MRKSNSYAVVLCIFGFLVANPASARSVYDLIGKWKCEGSTTMDWPNANLSNTVSATITVTPDNGLKLDQYRNYYNIGQSEHVQLSAGWKLNQDRVDVDVGYFNGCDFSNTMCLDNTTHRQGLSWREDGTLLRDDGIVCTRFSGPGIDSPRPSTPPHDAGTATAPIADVKRDYDQDLKCAAIYTMFDMLGPKKLKERGRAGVRVSLRIAVDDGSRLGLSADAVQDDYKKRTEDFLLAHAEIKIVDGAFRAEESACIKRFARQIKSDVAKARPKR